ncbi:MAG: VOC family protein [Thermoanaerobaculia bacterium]
MTTREIDYNWDKLSAVPMSKQCGWLKDQYGLSRQIVAAALDERMEDANPARLARVTQAVLNVKKVNLAALKGG